MNAAIKRFVPDDLAQAGHYLRLTRVNAWFLSLSMALSTVVALISLYLSTLLFPLISGIIARDFHAVARLPVLHFIVTRVPGHFHSSSSLLTLFVVWIYAVTVLRSVMGYGLSLVVRHEAARASHRMRVTVLDRYLRFGKSFFDRHDVSSLVWQATNCNRWIEGLFLQAQSLLSNSLELAVYFAVMVAISWKMALAVVLALPLFGSVRWLLRRIHAASRNYSRTLSDLHTRLTELLSFLTLVRTSGQSMQERERFIELCSDEMKVALRIHQMTALIDPVQEVSGTTAFLLIALCLSWFVPQSDVGATKIFVFFFLLFRSVTLLNAMGRTRGLIVRDTALAQSLDAILLDPGEREVVSGPRKLAVPISSVDVRGLTFGYPGRDKVLEGVDLSLRAGQTVGLVGPTGTGKTTLAHLLMRFYDCPPGTIFVNGIDIREFDVDSLRSQMALVSQEAAVLNDTIRANIVYSTERMPSDIRLKEILEKARLTELVNRLPEKLDTVVGERGVMLSGGERQRIAIARALLKDASFLVLDEPTSALDPLSERLVAEALREMMAGRATLVIAHRLSTLRNADTIVFLQGGRIAQSGTFADLAQEPGPFKSFLEAQRLPEGA